MLLIKNGLVLTPGPKRNEKRDIFVKDGKIAPPGEVQGNFCGAAVLDAAGWIVAPGLVDMHVHFRDPGFLYKEDVYTGARAAAAGGVTTAACMPNTSPVLDSAEAIEDLVAARKRPT
jgi:dihydroorotase